jgi:transposase
MLFRRGKAYSQDLRDRVFALSDAGDPVGEIAEALCVSVSYVSKALSRRRDGGERAARPQRCHVPPKLLGLYDAIRTEVTSRPDATLGELRRWLHEKHRVSASDGLMHATLARLGLTHKKRPCTPPSRNGPMLPRHAPHGASSNLAWRRGG